MPFSNLRGRRRTTASRPIYEGYVKYVAPRSPIPKPPGNATKVKSPPWRSLPSTKAGTYSRSSPNCASLPRRSAPCTGNGVSPTLNSMRLPAGSVNAFSWNAVANERSRIAVANGQIGYLFHRITGFPVVKVGTVRFNPVPERGKTGPETADGSEDRRGDGSHGAVGPRSR